jgi:hypothetical protein
MTASKTNTNILKNSLLAAFALAATLAQANHVGDWQSVPGLASGYWDNSSNNWLGNSNTWQTWNGSSWVTENGTNAGTSYPSNNTGLITILSGTTISNSGVGSSSNIFDGLVVQSDATFLFANGTNTLLHPASPNSEYTIDMDVFGNFGLSNTKEPNFFINSNATIVMESGSTMTNYGLASLDHFTGPGYTNATLGGYVPGAITFKSGSTYVQTTGSDAKGYIPHATWETGSTCLIAPGLNAIYVFDGMAGQTFYNLTWYWPLETQNDKKGGIKEAGSFTVNGNFSMTAGSYTTTNAYIPSAGNTLTVGGNIGLTNVTWAPTTTAGVVTLNVGGDFIVDDSAQVTIDNASAWGNVTFDGGTTPSNPQVVQFGALFGTNGDSLGSRGSWNWIVNSGSSVSVNSAWTVNYGTANVPGSAGFITNNGTITLTANGVLSGTSNTIILGSSGTLDVTAGTWNFGAEDTLQGSGTIVGPVTASSTSVIYPNSGAALTFNGTLTYGGTTSTNIFNLTSNPASGNDQIVVNGPGGNGSLLHPNGAQIVINPLGPLSTTTDYVLFNVTGGGSIANSGFTGPAWTGNNIPADSANYYIVTSGNQVLLHYSTTVPQPDLTSTSFSGNDVTFNGSAVAGTYTLLRSTNLTASLPSWTVLGTFSLTTSGGFTSTINNVLDPSYPAQYFVLRRP